MRKKCTCGRGEYCTSTFSISGAGVVHVDSEGLIHCGKFQEQAKKASEIVKAHKNKKRAIDD